MNMNENVSKPTNVNKHMHVNNNLIGEQSMFASLLTKGLTRS